jgi:hypothetical protein
VSEIESGALVPVERVERLILLLRGRRVLLDADLAILYGVKTKALNQAVKRNIARFPEDFMFQLTAGEKQELVTNCDQFSRLKHSRSLPYAFTEHGAIMAANVLNTRKAVSASVYVIRAFVRLREMLATHSALSRKLEELERRVDKHDEAIVALVAAIKQLAMPPEEPKRRIGFKPGQDQP